MHYSSPKMLDAAMLSVEQIKAGDFSYKSPMVVRIREKANGSVIAKERELRVLFISKDLESIKVWDIKNLVPKDLYYYQNKKGDQILGLELSNTLSGNLIRHVGRIRSIPAFVESRDAALLTVPGGIDLNSKNLNIETSGQKVNITFDPAMIAQFRRGDFSGVQIQILDVVPISLMPLLGLKEDETDSVYS